MRKQWAVAIALGVLALSASVALIQGRATSKEETSASTATRPGPEARPGLPPPPAPPRGTLSVRGRVVDAHGQPVAGVQVSATQALPGESLSQLPCEDTSPGVTLAASECGVSEEQLQELVTQERGGAPVLAQATTGADGTFQLDALPEGTVALWALGERGSAMEPEVATGREGVELVLTQSLSLAGSVVDESGAPLAGAKVTLFHQQHSRYFTVYTGRDGRFSFGPLPAGDYGLVASSPGLMPAHVRDVAYEELEGLVLHPPRQLTGRVLLADGRPAPGARVRVDYLSDSSEVDAEGRFSLGPIAPGDYVVFAERDGQHGYVRVSITEEGQGEEATVYLGTLVHIEGTVRDEAGHPIAGASVSGYAGETAPPFDEVTTDEDGHFRLGPMAPASYTFSADADGYLELQKEDVEVAANVPPLSFTLVRAHVLSGTVTDAEGHPLQDVDLEAVKVAAAPRKARATDGEDEEEPPEPYSATTDEGGRFLLEVGEPGRYVLTAGGDSYIEARLEVDAPDTALHVVLRGGATLEGTVVDATGAPLEQVQLTVRLGTEAQELETLTDEHGAFSIGGVPPGTHVLHAKLDLGAFLHTASRTVTVRGTETVDASLRMDTGKSVSGIVVDGDGRPVPDAEVSAWSLREQSGEEQGMQPSTATTGADGRFTVRHLPEGACSLLASKPGHTFDVPRRETPNRGPGLDARTGATDVRLVLRYQGFILGRVVHADGTPIPRFGVNQEAFRSPDGAFRVPMESPGPTRLLFEAPGLVVAVREVDAPPGRDVDLGDVRLEPGRNVRGRVVDAETAKPVAGAQVRVNLADKDSGGASRALLSVRLTDEDGTFTLPPLERLALELEVLHEGYPRLLQRFGADDDVWEVRLPPGARVEGTVTDGAGRPVDTRVVLTPVGRKGNQDSHLQLYDPPLFTMAAGGRFLAERVPGGDYLVSADEVTRPEGGRVEFLPQRVRVPPMGRMTVALVERAGTATLRLRVEPPRSPGDIGAALIPGALPATASRGELRILLAQKVPLGSNAPDGARVYERLPAGHYTLLLFEGWMSRELRIYTEELDLSDGESAVRVVTPVWRAPAVDSRP